MRKYHINTLVEGDHVCKGKSLSGHRRLLLSCSMIYFPISFLYVVNPNYSERCDRKPPSPNFAPCNSYSLVHSCFSLLVFGYYSKNCSKTYQTILKTHWQVNHAQNKEDQVYGKELPYLLNFSLQKTDFYQNMFSFMVGNFHKSI